MSITELALILFVALILFGPEDLPVIARALGKIMFEVRKFTQEISKEFQDALETPSNVFNEALKDGPKITSQREKSKEENEELLTYWEAKEDVLPAIPAQEMNPLSELPSDIVSYPKDTQAGE